jgi:hypothetical protein
MPDAGNTQAFILIAFLIATPVLCIAGYGKPGTWRIGISLVAGLLMALVCAVSGMHRCLNGAPFLQWLIPAACATAVLVLVRSRWIRFSMVTLYFVVSIWLCQDYAHLVHTPDYHGNSAILERQREQTLFGVKQGIRNKAAKDMTAYPAGWMHEAPLLTLVDADSFFLAELAADSPLWHSWLTGLYELRQGGIWYPGGRLSEAVDKIEYRERESR